MHSLSQWLIALTACLGTALTTSGAEKFVLVRNGAEPAPIIVAHDATPFTRMAARELAGFIEKISGARPAILEDLPDPLPERAVWIGRQPVLNTLFPGTDFDFQQAEEILIMADARNLVIAGRDVWDPLNHVRQLSRGRTVENVQREYGTVNAIYTFIQDYLDVRWLWPGALGEDIPQSSMIEFEPFEYRYHPQFRGRIGLFSRCSLAREGFRTASADQNWARYQRLLFDSLDIPGGHAYGDWWKRFHETHPEYLALQPDGTRAGGDQPYPSAGTVKICHSNPGVLEQWLADVEAQIAIDPSRTVFNASPNDGGNSGHCICEECQAWDNPDAEKLYFSWRGLSEQYVAISDRTITFANKAARRLKKKYPDRDYFVYMLAYGNWRPVPVAVVPDDNVIIGSVANFHNRLKTGRTGLASDARDLFLRWAEVAPNIAWRPNLGFSIWQVGLPRVSMRRAIDDLRMVAENNVIGIFFDTLWLHWATHGPHYYMLGRMAWNPYADGDAILADYYQRGFGPGAGAVEEYWNLMAAATAAYVFDENVGWPDVYNAELFDEAGACLDRAAGQVADFPGKYAERIDFVRVGLDFTRLYMEARELMLRYHASKGADTAAQDQAREIWLVQIRPLLRHPHAFSEAFAGPRAGRALRNLYPDGLLEQWY